MHLMWLTAVWQISESFSYHKLIIDNIFSKSAKYFFPPINKGHVTSSQPVKRATAYVWAQKPLGALYDWRQWKGMGGPGGMNVGEGGGDFCFENWHDLSFQIQLTFITAALVKPKL